VIIKHTTRALLVTSSFRQGHEIRKILRSNRQSVALEVAPSQRILLDCLHKNRSNLLLVDQNSVPDLTALDVIAMGQRQSPPIPVILLGARSEDQVLLALQSGAIDALRESEMQRLPVAMKHALHKNPLVENQPERLGGKGLESPRPVDAMRESQKMATIGRLTASIAHEINNPLESITNLLFLMADDPMLSGSTRNYLQMAQHELARVTQISTQTLNFYREAPAPIATDLSRLLDEVLVLYARRIEEKHLAVIKEYEVIEPVTVLPGEMRQVFSNLISNAIEASSAGGQLRLRIRATRHVADGEVRGIRISVADSGSGIPAQVRNRLGEPFFTTKGERGTGLGLWVTQSILQRYGGNLQLHSSVSPRQHGTVFTVFLPTNLRPTILPSTRAAVALEEPAAAVDETTAASAPNSGAA